MVDCCSYHRVWYFVWLRTVLPRYNAVYLVASIVSMVLKFYFYLVEYYFVAFWEAEMKITLLSL